MPLLRMYVEGTVICQRFSSRLQKEYDRLLAACAVDRWKLPLKRDLAKKAVEIQKFSTQRFTEVGNCLNCCESF